MKDTMALTFSDVPVFLLQAKRAIHRGATAVVFDITDNHLAAKELQHNPGPSLDRPLVLVGGAEANRLMTIVETRRVARARITSAVSEMAAQVGTYCHSWLTSRCHIVKS